MESQWQKLANRLFNAELANSMANIITGLKVANAVLKHKDKLRRMRLMKSYNYFLNSCASA